MMKAGAGQNKRGPLAIGILAYHSLTTGPTMKRTPAPAPRGEMPGGTRQISASGPQYRGPRAPSVRPCTSGCCVGLSSS